MPLRDHFRPPLSDRRSWDGLYGGWPALIAIGLNRTLQERYLAEPRIHLRSTLEVDPTTDFPNVDEYEVRVYDTKSGRRLVAAIELVSPSNKDRPEHRRAFVAKCAAMMRESVCVVIVDLVTIRNSNLYAELLEFLGQTDPSLASESSPLYASACRQTRVGEAWQLQTWNYPLTLGQPLPTLPLWLAENLAVPLELEVSYEETCRVLRIA